MIAAYGFSGNPAQAANVAKIGIIDFQRILETSDSGKTAQAEINRQGKKMEAELKKKGAAIEELKKKLEREALIMSKDMREQKAREMRIKVNDLKTLQQKYMQEFKAKEKTLVQQIQKKIVDAVTKIGKKEGYLLILEKREGGVLYSPASIDITDKLIKMLNADSKKK
jgi:outer membrane protein